MSCICTLLRVTPHIHINAATSCSEVILCRPNSYIHAVLVVTLVLLPLGDERNVIMWLDHRAVRETKTINDTKHEVLKYVGGKVSLEMQSPKMLWLKQVFDCTLMPSCLCYSVCIYFFNSVAESPKILV